ncbi:MAG TPA: hypothetical protein PK595_00485 [Bacteroidota bacterium]|nr:hypothetical protein [Bacteroidota bacterium]
MNSSFILSECLKIFIPGFNFATVLFAFIKIAIVGKQPITFSIGEQVLFFLFTILISGLTMYAQEMPKRRKAFQENQPSAYLQTLSRTGTTHALNDDEAKQLYFYILNNHIPDRFHEKIIFFGTIYSIIIQIRRTSFWFGIIALVFILSAFLSYGFSYLNVQLLVYSIVMFGIYYLTVRYNKAERKMQENYQDQILWLHLNKELVKSLLEQFPQQEKKYE